MSEVQSFTARARMVLKTAEKTAAANGHKFVEPEHLLIALYEEKGTAAEKALAALNTDITGLHEYVRVSKRLHASGSGTGGVSTRTKIVLKQAAQEAKALSQDFIGPEHLLIGLAREAGSYEGILRAQNLTPEKIREQVYSVLEIPYTKPPENVSELPFSMPRSSEEMRRRISERRTVWEVPQPTGWQRWNPFTRIAQWVQDEDTRPAVVISAAILIVVLGFSYSPQFGALLLVGLPLAGLAYLFIKYRVQ
jgi:hypothetical protein